MRANFSAIAPSSTVGPACKARKGGRSVAGRSQLERLLSGFLAVALLLPGACKTAGRSQTAVKEDASEAAGSPRATLDSLIQDQDEVIKDIQDDASVRQQAEQAGPAAQGAGMALADVPSFGPRATPPKFAMPERPTADEFSRLKDSDRKAYILRRLDLIDAYIVIINRELRGKTGAARALQHTDKIKDYSLKAREKIDTLARQVGIANDDATLTRLADPTLQASVNDVTVFVERVDQALFGLTWTLCYSNTGAVVGSVAGFAVIIGAAATGASFYKP